ncbi:MAG: S41 family peptidase [Bacillota bacterium]
MLMLQDEAFLTLVYPNTPLSTMPTSYKAQTYHYLALVLEMFYGLDDYFAIDDFYAVLDPFEAALLEEDIDGHYDAIVDSILALDERHSGIRYHGFYKDDQVIDRETYELGPRVSELNASELWLKDNYCEYESLIDLSEDGTLARVRFNQFMEDAYLDFLAAIDTLETFPHLESVIIDLSCNSGGLLSILLSASGLFTDDEFTFSYVNTLHNEQSTFSIISPIEQLPYTLYIQTSEFSYSASHIFTTYIDAYDLATIIGQPTGGGAAAIRDMVLPNGSHIVVSSPLVFVGPDNSIIELSHDPDILIPYEDFNDLDMIQTYLE